MVRYVVELQIICREDQYLPVRNILRRHKQDKSWALPVKVRFEKSDPAADALVRELQEIGHKAVVFYVPAFEPWEVEQADLLHMSVRAMCGMGFAQWAKELCLPPGTLVMDKREMGRRDIAVTYTFDIVVSDRMKEVLSLEGLTGWRTEAVRHIDPMKDRFAPIHALTATNQLPALAPETELHLETHHHERKEDPLFGTTGLFQRGPLCYRRRDLRVVEDFNFTRELFGEAPEAHPYLILSQRAWKVLCKNRVRNVEVEPVVILE